MNTVVQILGAVGESGRGRTDRQLLELFVKLRDEEAFAAVVRRHGPMVLGVCRRVLRNVADADDAFQAAFLVLARKAATIAGRDQLGPWLHGVAFNASRKLKRANARRSAHEHARAATAETVVLAPEPHADLLAVLDEELARLPDRYRAVIVLCDLEGRTRKEASQVLACPEGTVGGRLARARELLAAKLRARGVSSALGAVSLAVAVAPGAVAALVRAVSIDGLAHAAARGFVSRRVLDTTEGVVRSMFATKLQKVGAAVLCCGLALACATGGIHSANAQPEPEWKPVPMLTEDPATRRVLDAALRAQEEAALRARAASTKSAKVIRLRVLDCQVAAEKLTKFFFPPLVTIAPLPDEKAMLVYAADKEMKEIESLLLKMGESPPKKATVFKLAKDADPAETAKTLADLLGKGRAVFVQVPEEGVLLVYASELDTQIIQKLLAKVLVAAGQTTGGELVRKTFVVEHRKVREVAEALQKLFGDRLHSLGWEEPNKLLVAGSAEAVATAAKLVAGQDRPLMYSTPRIESDPPKKYTLNFQNVAWADVLDWYAKASGLTLVAATKPAGRVTLAPGNREFTLGEVTDLINESLMQQKFILIRRHRTFFIQPSDEKVDPALLPHIALNELPARGRTEIVEVSISLRGIDAAEIKDEFRKMLTPFGEIVLAKGSLLTVRDTVGNILRIIQTLKDINVCGGGDSTIDPRLGVWSKGAKWKDVLGAYEQVTGLKGSIKSVPSGTFTFTLPQGLRPCTIEELTDAINESLLVEKHLLIRYRDAFVVVAAGEKIDPTFVPQVAPEALKRRWRTELIQTFIPVPPGTVADLVPEVEKLLGPFGSVVAFRTQNTILVQDITANVIKIHRALTGREMNLPGAERLGSGGDPRFSDPRFGGDPRGAVQPRLQGADPHMALPETKPVTFKFKDAKWKEVFEAYEKVTGLKGTIKSVPTGTFTFAPPKVAQQYTPAEFTDIVNDALLAEKHLLIRRSGGFVVVAADEKVDPILVPRIALEELERRGRTELVEVVIPVPPGAAAELVLAVKKLLGPFGSVVALRTPNAVLVQDVAANVIKIRKVLGGTDEPNPEK